MRKGKEEQRSIPSLIYHAALFYNARNVRGRASGTLHHAATIVKEHNEPATGMKKPIRKGWAGRACAQTLGRAGCLGGGTDAAGAPFNAHGLVVFHNCDGLQIRIEAAAGVAVRKADCITERRAFAAVGALRHVVPPKNKRILIYKTKTAVPNGDAAASDNHTMARHHAQHAHASCSMRTFL
jgi:hypothetical protein